jgi:protein-L-isoaspartate O-methyltransferase
MHKPFIENMRKDMVENQLRQRGITNDRVLDVMGDVPRHLFVAEDLRDEAYMDGPLPIGFDPDHQPAIHRGIYDGSLKS